MLNANTNSTNKIPIHTAVMLSVRKYKTVIITAEMSPKKVNPKAQPLLTESFFTFSNLQSTYRAVSETLLSSDFRSFLILLFYLFLQTLKENFNKFLNNY